MLGGMKLAQVGENRTVVPRILGRYLAQIAIVFAVQFAAGKIGDVLHTMNSGGIGPVWPASGIALGALLVWGCSVWPGVAAAAFFLTFLSGVPLWLAVLYAAGTTLAALLPAFVLRRFVKFDNTLSRLGDVVGLIVLGAFGGSVVSASIGVPALYAAHIFGWSGFGKAWLIYWLGDSTGVLVVTPLVLTLPTLFRVRSWNRPIELAVLLVLLIAACLVVFGILPIWLDILTFAVLPFGMWAALRFGPSVTALSIFLLATTATVETALNYGPFAANTPLINAVLLDVLFGVVSITGLTLAALGAEREEFLRQQATMETRLLADEALRLSEVKYRTVVEMTGTGYLIIDSQGTVLDANQEYVRLSGHAALREILGRSVIEWTAEGAKQRNAEAVAQCAKDGFIRNFVTEYVDGKGRATFIEVNATVEGEGESARIISLCRDVTERKRHEQAIQELSGRLISAQEQERSRIARELHDDINQRIALLAIELERWSQQLPESAGDLHDHIQHAGQRLSGLSKDIQALSHRLHSSKLEYLGIVAAANSFCKELSEQQNVLVQFSHSHIPRIVPNEISLCLFRVLQEALQNAVKHSGARQFKVELRGTPDEIQLTVSDLGTGFDSEEAMNRQGLGLVSMRERLGLVKGQFSVNSAPGRGTTIHACVPLSSSSDFARAAR
jgi:PAS domain S-box-containing protein